MAWIAVAVALAGVLASSTVLAADGEDGAKFFSSCKGLINYWDGKPSEANYDAAAMGYCVGVIHGVRGTLQILSEGVKDGYPRVCLTADYVEQEGVRTVVKFLEEHPDKLKLKDVTITMLALGAAYPCR